VIVVGSGAAGMTAAVAAASNGAAVTVLATVGPAIVFGWLAGETAAAG
jgi:succinate dehydrogenase/fumarate reductase flavoprotein subunit